jgi:hypothetical protein
MRFTFLLSLLVAFFAYAMATAPLKTVIVSYPGETPWNVVDEAIAAIEKAVCLLPTFVLS